MPVFSVAVPICGVAAQATEERGSPAALLTGLDARQASNVAEYLISRGILASELKASLVAASPSGLLARFSVPTGLHFENLGSPVDKREVSYISESDDAAGFNDELLSFRQDSQDEVGERYVSDELTPDGTIEDDDDWDFLDEKRMQRLCGKKCMRGWCCCSFMVLVNQCPTSLYLMIFLVGGFWILWSYQLIQPVFQMVIVFLYFTLAIIGVAGLVVLHVFTDLKRSGKAATRIVKDQIDHISEGFQSVQQGIENVMDAVNPFDDSSDDDNDGDEDKVEQVGQPPDKLGIGDFTCGWCGHEWQDQSPGDVVEFKLEDRVKCRDIANRWLQGFVVQHRDGESLPYQVPVQDLKKPRSFANFYIHCDNQKVPRKGWAEVRRMKKGDPGYKLKYQPLKKLRERQRMQGLLFSGRLKYP